MIQREALITEVALKTGMTLYMARKAVEIVTQACAKVAEPGLMPWKHEPADIAAAIRELGCRQ